MSTILTAEELLSTLEMMHNERYDAIRMWVLESMVVQEIDWTAPTLDTLVAQCAGRSAWQTLLCDAQARAVEMLSYREAEQIVLAVVRGLRQKTDVLNFLSDLERVGDLLARLRQQKPGGKG